MTNVETFTPTDTIPAISHREGVALGREAYGRFASLVETLSDEDWARPTDCAEWTVRELVGHVVGAMRSAASLRESASQMRAFKRLAKHSELNETDAMTQVQVDRTENLTPAELVAECRHLVDRAAVGRRRAPAPLRKLVRFPVEIGSIAETWQLGYLLDVVLTRDAWLHRIDLCRAIGQEPHLTLDHDGRIIADVASEWCRRHGHAVRLTLLGPAGGAFGSEGRGGAPESVEIDAVEFCRIVSGRVAGTGLLQNEVPF